MSEQKLTPKQLAFIDEYNKSGNATDAARKAGYKGNDVTLRQVGSENLSKPHILARVREKQQAKSERLELEADWELKKAIALYDEALANGEFMVANQVLNTIGKLRGKFVNKIEVGMADNIAEQLEDI